MSGRPYGAGARSTGRVDSPWRRLDARMIGVDAVRILLSLIPAAAAAAVSAQPGSLLWTALAVAGVGIATSAADLLRWWKTRYRVTDEHVERRTGVLVRRHRSVRRDRVRSVDTTAKLRHRLAGLRLVTITAGQQTAAGEAALSLDAVSRETAEALRRELLGRAPAVATTSTSAAGRGEQRDRTLDGGPHGERVIQRIRWSWVVYNVFNVWAFLMAAGLLWGAYWLAQSLGLDVAGFAAGLLDWRSLGWTWSVLIGLAAVGAIGVVGGLSGFNVAKMENPASLILPRGPVTVARRVAAAVLDDGVRPMDAALRRHPRAALRRRAVWAALLTGAVTGVLAWAGATVGFVAGWAWLAGPAALPVTLGLAVVAYRALGHALVGDYLVTRAGLNSRTTAALQRRAVIGWTLRQSVFQRRLGLVTVTATTAAGRERYSLVDADADEAVAFAEEAVPGLLAPFTRGSVVAPPGEAETRDQPRLRRCAHRGCGRRRDGRVRRSEPIPGAGEHGPYVQEVVLALVHGVATEPRDVPVGWLGIVVDARPAKLVGGQAAVDGRGQLCRHREVVGDRHRFLVRVAGKFDTFVAVHPREAGAMLDQRQQCAVALDQQHVAYVTGVLQRGPHPRRRPPPDRRLLHGVAAQLRSVPLAERANGLRQEPHVEFVVDEAALGALGRHAGRIARRWGQAGAATDP